MAEQKIKRVVGHIDKLDADGVTGWAFGPNNLPNITLRVGRVEVDPVIERRSRADVSKIYGTAAYNSGFFINLKGIAPPNPELFSKFASSLRVFADGRRIRPSSGAEIPKALRNGGIFNFGNSSKIFSRRTNDRSIPDEEYRRHFLEPARLARQHGKDLNPVQNFSSKIKPSDILAFVTIRNEMLRLPFVLDYYRKLGVNHFLFVDNNSTDNFLEYVKDQADCSVWHTKASYKASNFGVHWLNHLLHVYGVGHWCLTIDPDEILIYPNSEYRNLNELTEFLQSESTDHLFCIMMDMYSDRRVSETFYKSGQNPVDVAPFFDSIGYTQRENMSYGETLVRGGPRRRVFFREQPDSAPALNKTPLVKWGKDYNYLSSTHVLAPKSVNIPHKSSHLCPTGCLLHFKFISLIAEKSTEEIGRKEHYANSMEYRKYHSVISEGNDALYFEKSTKYVDTRKLCELGFMSLGRWF